MKLPTSSLLVVLGAASAQAAFVPNCNTAPSMASRSSIVVRGYLDDLTPELNKQVDEIRPEEETHEATKMKQEDKDRYGPGNFDDFVDFQEFDGGDGQMGVAGDGQQGLEKLDSGPLMGSTMQKSLQKSKAMSAKNAWGTSTGYADDLMKKNPKMDISRAQQLENWQNQQEVRRKTLQQQQMAEAYDEMNYSEEENWRALAKFGVERNQEFDLDDSFGAVTAGDIEGVIEMKANAGQMYTEFLSVKNEFMGFADFRASFTPESGPSFTVEPTEGSLSAKEPTELTIRFRPQGPGTVEGYLVVETEDFKKTWKIVGST